MAKICGSCAKKEATVCCDVCKSVFYCDTVCQQKHSSEHTTDCKPAPLPQTKSGMDACVVDVNDHKCNNEASLSVLLPPYNNTLISITSTKFGYGIVANCDIKRGTIIYGEQPLITLPDYAKSKMVSYIKHQIESLSAEQQAIYKALSRKNSNNNDMDDAKQLIHIWLNNQMPIASQKMSAVFAVFSRLNHACDCNAHCVWNEAHNEHRLLALRDIEKDTEIVINYCVQPMTFEQRKKKLKIFWNFECQCKWCVDDKIRAKMDEVIEEYDTLSATLETLMNKPLEGYKAAQKLVKIVEKYFSMNPYLLHQHCYDAAQFALGLQRWNEAVYYLEASFKQKQVSDGQDIAMDDEFKEKVNLLPPSFRTKFKKFDSKYKAKLVDRSKSGNARNVAHNIDVDDVKLQTGNKDTSKSAAKSNKKHNHNAKPKTSKSNKNKNAKKKNNKK